MLLPSRIAFRLDPPETFRYTDFVIRAALPRVPHSMTEEAAKAKYLRTRLKRLMRVVEARLGKGRCFFGESQPRDRKKDTQFSVTKLYALYEVEHWPGALAQYEWTQFVIANMERDAIRERLGSDVKLALPMLPSSALPKYQEMMRQEGSDLTRRVQPPGQINGVVSGGGRRVYTSHDPRRNELHDRPTAHHLSERAQLMVRLPDLPDIRRTLFEIPSGQLQAISRNDRLYRSTCDSHKSWVQKESKSLTSHYIRCLGREPDANLLTWPQLKAEARKLMGSTLYQQIIQWTRQQPNLNFKLGDGTELVDRQLSFLTIRMNHHDPIPHTASIQVQTERTRKHRIVAMLQQRQSLREWTIAVAEQARLCVGQRYRKELDHVLDFWTGKAERLEEFNERNRKENTGLRSDMLPVGAQPAVSTAQVQEQEQPQVQGPMQAQVHDQTTQSEVSARQQEQEVDHTPLLERMQQKARIPNSVHTHSQLEALNEAQSQPQSLRSIQTQGRKQEHVDIEMIDSIRAHGHHQVQANAQTTDSAQAQAQATEPIQLKACRDVNIISPAASQTPAREEAQEEVCNQSPEPEQLETFTQFQAQVHICASSCEEVSTGASNAFPMENVVHEHEQHEDLGQIQQQGVPRAHSPKAVSVPELVSLTAPSAAPVQIQAHVPLHVEEMSPLQAQEEIQQHAQELSPSRAQEEMPQHTQKLSQVFAPLTQPKPAEAQEVSLFQRVIQARLQHSLPGDSQGSLAAQNAAPLTLCDCFQDKVTARVQAQSQMLPIEQARPQQVPRAEEQLTSEQQNPGGMLVEGQAQETVPCEERDQTQAEQSESQEAQLHAAKLDAIENPVVAMDEEVVEQGSQPPTQFSHAQRAEEDNVNPTRPSDSGPQVEKTASHRIEKCHHCTKSKLRCNGERPCQFCLKYRKCCYDLNARPARNMRGRNLKTSNRSTANDGKRRAAAPETADDQPRRQPKPLEEVLSTQQESAGQPQGAITTNNVDATELDTHLSDDDDDDGTERLESFAASETPHRAQSQGEYHGYDTKQQQQQQTQSQPTKAARKPKQKTLKARNVTTRLAEQKEAEQGRRSLRAMAHRSHT
ncbi:hypothetical protein G647_00395 [Cladophialophora carrionii CBS 160.54]|uniref:Zn(2)-C6 fungal-type domain-containing protein n=1 Tax=Cladophialophora carrionii CBS 160.54 TaxID=1279043 RepID=V9DMS7_9EURO|nr:uncharacterized protein G647_00395 [Cladophialophora carrionii CBS 160.54]ETI27946.1 hypothetical protein G647_00395 [Cladophialophora carrionii CBS 160.54]